MGAEQQSTGVSRRDLLKKAAVAGSVAWVAPTVLANPAFAANPCQCADGPNGSLFGLKWDNPSSATPNATPGTNVSTGNCAASAGYTTHRSGLCLFEAGLITATISNSGLNITIAQGISYCAAFAKCGNQCESGAQQVTVTNNPDGTTSVRVDCDGSTGGGLSHIELIVCVNGTNIPADCNPTP